jgi:hypothetical protein
MGWEKLLLLLLLQQCPAALLQQLPISHLKIAKNAKEILVKVV